MILPPSKAIGLIDDKKRIVNKRFEDLRQIAQYLVECNFPLEEYIKWEPISLHRNDSLEKLRGFRRESLPSDNMGGKYIKECLDLITMLKSFSSSKHKPSEDTINSTIKRLIIAYCFTAYALPEELLSDIDNDISDTNKKLNDFKHVCEVMHRYGITDSKYTDAYAKYFIKSWRNIDLVILAYRDKMAELLDLAHFVESSNIQPYKSWWHRLFRIKTIDETTQSTLNTMLELYVKVTN